MVDSGSLRSKGWEKCLEALTVPLQRHTFPLSPSPLVCTRPLRWDRLDASRTAACLPQSAPHTLITNTNSFPDRNIALHWKYAGAIRYRAYTLSGQLLLPNHPIKISHYTVSFKEDNYLHHLYSSNSQHSNIPIYTMGTNAEQLFQVTCLFTLVQVRHSFTPSTPH